MTEQHEEPAPAEENYFPCSINKFVWKGTRGVKAKTVAEPHPLYPSTRAREFSALRLQPSVSALLLGQYARDHSPSIKQ